MSVVTVNSTLDTTVPDSVLTLREAILFTNGSLFYGNLSAAEKLQIDTTEPIGTNDTIKFNIPGGGLQIISLDSNLPTITSRVTIDGYSQPGSAAATDSAKATLNIELDAYDIDDHLDGNTTNGDGLVIAAKNVTVRGLDIVNAGNAGIRLLSGSGNDTIAGNYIGLTTGIHPENAGNGDGIQVVFSSENTIGGTTPADRNIISGNKRRGISFDVASSNNTVEGNYIGTLSDGSAALGNFDSGISVSQSTGNNIGGTSAGARNIISGNSKYGIQINTGGAGASGNVIEGNYIGTDVTGTTAVANTSGGVDLDGTVDNTQRQSLIRIGGIDAGAGNLISGNGGAGITIVGQEAQGNTIQGNRIGTNAAGTAALGNGKEGIHIFRADSNRIGGPVPGAGNVISGNTGDGVYLYGSSEGIVQGNLIGVLVDGITAAGNGGYGVVIDSGSDDNLVGAGVASSANVIAYNAGGVNVRATEGDAPIFNTIRLNSIFSNTALGIDLSIDSEGVNFTGVTPNDAKDTDTGGPNDEQNFPLIDTASATDAALTIFGHFNSTPSLDYLIDFYASPTADPSGYGQGKQYIGSVNVSTASDGNASFGTVLNAAIGANVYITATATELNGAGAGDTSEFSQAVKAAVTTTPPPPTPPSVSINDVSLNEGNAGTTAFTFTITRSGDLTGTSIVSVSTADVSATAPSDYAAQTGTLVAFAANQATATFTVNVSGDTTVENSETFEVNISSVSNATIGDGQGVGTITNDDVTPPPPTTPSVAINDVAVSEGNAGTTAFTFTITRSGDLSAASSVSVSTANKTASSASDYTAQSGTPVSFAIGQATATVTVLVNGDTAVESDETFFVSMTAVTNATVSDGQGVGTILNDDVAVTPPITIKAPTKLSGTVTSSSAVALKWKDNANNETGFEVQYLTSSNFAGATTVPVPGANVSAASISGLMTNTTYYFRVRAVGPNNSASGYSNLIKLTTKKAPAPVPVVTGFNLINSDTKQVVLTITDGMVIHRSDFPALKNFSVQALVGGTVESVKFSYKGKTSIQNIAPYSLFGDHGVGNYDGQPFANGSYTITATPYTLDNAKGTAGSAVTIHFTVVN